MRLVAALLATFPGLAFAYGEPDGDGRPGREERLLVALTNEVRQDPHAWPGWDTRLAPGDRLPPLVGVAGLFSAARFHADDMAKNDFFSHTSHDGTPFGERISRYYAGSAGENIYASTERDAYAALDAWMNSEGHRTNILRPAWSSLGAGHAAGNARHYYVQNFGAGRALETPAIPAASHRSLGAELELVANFFDARGRPATSVVAELGGTSVALAKRTGADGNSTHAARAPAPAGCAPLVFVATDASGSTTRYPTTGSFLAGSGGCADFAGGGGGSSTGGVVIDAEDGGCRSAGQPGAWALLLAFALLARRR